MDTVKYLKITKKGHKYTLKVVYTNNALLQILWRCTIALREETEI